VLPAARSESFCAWLSLKLDFNPTSSTCSVETSAVSSAADSACAAPSGGVLDTLKKVDEQQAPSGPQAPRSQ